MIMIQMMYNPKYFNDLRYWFKIISNKMVHIEKIYLNYTKNFTKKYSSIYIYYFVGIIKNDKKQ